MSRKKRKSKLPPFVPVIKTTMATPVWRAMSFGARLLYLELRGCLRNDYVNNGKVFRSCRDAAKALGTQSTRSIVRWYAELEHYGFIRKTAEGFLGADGRGIAAHYRFTEFPHGTNPPTRDFEKWNGEPFVYTPRRPGRKKQKPVSPRDTPRVPQGHIRKGANGSSVCAPQGHIGSTRRCAPQGHTSRKASREAEPSLDQGSSMARAPVQAGDAGSSPAPDANRGESLTEHVLSVVNAELANHERRRNGGYSSPPNDPSISPNVAPAHEQRAPAMVSANGNGGDISKLQFQNQRDWYADDLYRHGAATADAKLRERLSKMMAPDCVETEFGRVTSNR